MTEPASPQAAILPLDGARIPQDARPRSAWAVVVPLAAALLASIAWLSAHAPALDAVRELPPAERAAVVSRTLANLRDACGGPDRSREFCKGQAELVLRLPECDAACRAVAQAELEADLAVR